MSDSKAKIVFFRQHAETGREGEATRKIFDSHCGEFFLIKETLGKSTTWWVESLRMVKLTEVRRTRSDALKDLRDAQRV